MFQHRLHERIASHDTRLCLGLDPRLGFYGSFEQLKSHTLQVLEACAPHVACIKPQLAFYEALGLPGMAFLFELVTLGQTLNVPVILDTKRGDIGSTAEAYAKAWLTGPLAGCAITVNPYLGFETLQPFITTARENGGGVFVLVKTSNPDSKDIQDLKTAQGTVAEHVAKELTRLAKKEKDDLSSIGAVVGATHSGELAHFRELLPYSTLLLPGLGAQGAHAADLAPAFLTSGTGAIVNASRGIQYASPSLDIAASVQAAITFKTELNVVAKPA